MALGSAIEMPTSADIRSPAHARFWRRLGLGPIDNGKRCFLCLRAEWAMVEESAICHKCDLCRECCEEIGEEC
jgi:hypothetical protein